MMCNFVFNFIAFSFDTDLTNIEVGQGSRPSEEALGN